MNGKRLWVLMPAVTLALLGAVLWHALWKDPRKLPSALVDRAAPSFELPRLDGSGSFRPESMRGKVWLLNVWASWCAACTIEHPRLLDLAQRQVVPIVGLSYKDTLDAGRKWLQRNGNPYQVVAFDLAGRVGIDYGVYGVPETYLIDANGIVRARHAGPIDDAFIKGPLEQVLKEGAR